MKTLSKKLKLTGLLALLLSSTAQVFAYDSGSTGADGAFSPVVDTEVVLPPDGIFNYTTVNIPAGVVVTFRRNQVNTPVTWLTTGDVTIDGKVVLSGTGSAHVGTAGTGSLGDDGLPGLGGPGGFDGGVGGNSNGQTGSAGFGPGRGLPAIGSVGTRGGCGGSGGAYAGNGGSSRSLSDTRSRPYCTRQKNGAVGGTKYGDLQILPLIGGSGGGGASGGFSTAGSGGGGGGGAILIASSATVTVNGELRADGGRSGVSNGASGGGSGGGGAGGAIRIIATTLTGNGAITANAGIAGSVTIPNNDRSDFSRGGDGSAGRIRFEAENFLRTSVTTPNYSLASPGDRFVSGSPTIRITSVATQTAPAIPTGNADIVLPITTSNPVTVSLASTGIPVGNTVKVTMIPSSGNPVSVISSALTGTENAATASANVDLPEGPSVLQAEVNYSVTQQ